MLVKVLLYGYCAGVASSPRIAQRLHEASAFRALDGAKVRANASKHKAMS